MSERTARAAPTVAPFRIRGRFFTAIVLQMVRSPDSRFYEGLDAMLAQTPHFFMNAPFALDLDKAVGLDEAGAFASLAGEFKRRGLALIGVQSGSAAQVQAARDAGLIALQGGRDLPQDQDDSKRANGAAPPTEPPRGGAMLVTEPVRSGQRIFAELGDLVVVAPVSSGAELIARGNIHVYGRMRGRALAGANGDTKARIFCHSLEAELLAIAGLYMTSDEIDQAVRKRRVQVYLKDDAVRVEPLT